MQANIYFLKNDSLIGNSKIYHLNESKHTLTLKPAENRYVKDPLRGSLQVLKSHGRNTSKALWKKRYYTGVRNGGILHFQSKLREINRIPSEAQKGTSVNSPVKLASREK